MLYHAFGVQEGYDYERRTTRMAVSGSCCRSGPIGSNARVAGVGTSPARAPFPGVANGADWFEAGVSGDQVPKCQCAAYGKRFEVSPLAPACAHYTRRLEAFVNDLRGLRTVSDLAAIT